MDLDPLDGSVALSADHFDTDASTYLADDAPSASAGGVTVWDYDAVPEAVQTEIGVNVTQFAAGGPRDTLIFVNQIKAAWPWLAVGGKALDAVSFDDTGYVASKPDDVTMVSDLMRRSSDLDGQAPFTGEFRLFGQGSGTFSLGTGLQRDLHDRVTTDALPTVEIGGETYWYVDFDYSSAPDADGRTPSAKMFLKAVETGDHIRDLALVHASHLDAFAAGEVFAPEFVADLEPYGELRFMDWMNTNILELDESDRAIDPDQRYIGPDHFTFNTRASGKDAPNVFASSMPIEHIVGLGNATGNDIWINLPATITDAQAARMASYVRDHLDPGLEATWEYGNEVWNFARGFESYYYAARMAVDTFDAVDTLNVNGAVEWAAYRGPQLYDMIDALFAGDDNAARFVAPMWSYDGPVDPDGDLNGKSFTMRYFAAEEAQKMADAPSRPADIVTDYAVGMYFGGGIDAPEDSALMAWLMDAYDTDGARAEALAKLQLAGLDPAKSYDLSERHLSEPIRGVALEDGPNIQLGRLIWKDIREDGVHPMDGLTDLLRLDGAALQYRGARAADWTTILEFSDVPDLTIAEMVADITLSGWAFKRDGVVIAGLKGGLVANAEMRLDQHLAYVESLGLDFVAYEGGPHIGEVSGVAGDVIDAYVDAGYSQIVYKAWLEQLGAADVDTFMAYMSHSRFADDEDFWGIQKYAGQPAGESPQGEIIFGTIAAGPAAETAPVIARPISGDDDGQTGSDPVDPVDPVDPADPVDPDPAFGPDAGWSHGGAWSLGADGTATQAGGENDPLTLQGIAVTPGTDYTLSFDVAAVTAAEPGKLRIVVKSYGNGSTELLRRDVDLVAGERLSFDLSDIPADHDQLRVILRRSHGPEGDLVLGDLALDPVDPADPDPAFGPDAGWSHGGAWSLGADGTATQAGGENDPLTLQGIAVTPGTDYTLSFDVAAVTAAEPGKLRIVVQSYGNGSTELLRRDVDLISGERLSFGLSDIPADHDQLRVILRRSHGPEGDLVLGDLALAPLAIM